MQLKFLPQLVFSVLCFMVIALLWGHNSPSSEVAVVRLGNPLADDGKKGRSLNVWDLQVFDGKIYVGGGDTSKNVGPMNVWAYDPATTSFIKEANVAEEAILQYKVIDDQLYIPAADPRGNDNSKFYRLSAGGEWEKFTDKSLKLAHIRDLIKVNNKLLLVGNSRPAIKDEKVVQGAVITDSDQVSFRPVTVDNLPDTGNVSFLGFDWFFTVFAFQNKIFAPNAFLRDTGGYPGSIAVYNPQIERLALDFKLGSEEFIPQANIDPQNGKHGVDTIYQIWQPLVYQDHLVYTARSFSNAVDPRKAYQLYFNSLGVYLKPDLGVSPQEIRLPHQAIGENLLLIEDELYLLANRKRGTKFTIYVYKTNQIAKHNWTEVLSFSSSNKARSFEYLDGDFYFGLGQDFGEAIANSGDILRYTLP
ncbi:MAG: hypothetical protein AAFQ14_01855 [Cyanobacteria bacterium J06621_12]